VSGKVPRLAPFRQSRFAQFAEQAIQTRRNLRWVRASGVPPERLVATPDACDSHAVFSGRGITLLGGIAATAVIGLIPAIGSANPVAQTSAKKKPPLKFSKVRVFSDHSVTPGQQEWITVAKLPPRTRFKVAIEPPPTTPQCGQYYFCNSVRVFPVPGTPPYRSSGKGRATVSFVMPSQYVIQSDPFGPSTKQPVTFMNGQALHIDVYGAKRTRKATRVGFGFGRTVVYLPPES
jgi:hypothetical protein